MTVKYYALLTTPGAAKLANAAALGTKLQITQMAVGDGGGKLPTPNASQTALVGEQRRAPLNQLSIDAANSSQIIAEQIIPETDGGFWIREIGLFDADGTMIAVANCAETYKPQLQEGSGRTQTVRMILIVSSTDAVTLKIDPSVVLATRKYVDDAVIEVKAYADSVMKKHTDAGNPHSQYLQIANALGELKDAKLIDKALKNLGLSEIPGRLINVQVFTSSGTYTPTTGTRRIIIEAQGGGGGGANAKSTATNTITLACSGGAGGYVKHEITNPGASYPYAVGAGGAADTKGGNTSIAGCVALGGQPGVQIRNNLASNGQAISLGGDGGAASGGNILNTQGNAAGIAIFLNGPVLCPGGSSVLGSGGRGAGATSSAGQPGSNGGGGGGATSSDATLQVGERGGDGLIIVWEYA